MAKRFGHIGQVAQQQAVALLETKPRNKKKQCAPSGDAARDLTLACWFSAASATGTLMI
jgi:hypothetical protein